MLNRILLISLILIGLSACSTTPPKVKVLIGMPGVNDEFATYMTNAMQLAYQDMTTTPKYAVELEFVDVNDPNDSANPTYEKLMLEKYIQDNSIVAFIGMMTSARAKDTLPFTNMAGLAVVSPAATWPGLTKAGYGVGEPSKYYPSGERSFFRVVPADDIQGVAAGHWLQAQGYQRIYIVAEDSIYGRGLVGILEANAPDLGLTIIAKEMGIDTQNGTDADIQAVAERVVAANPDVVYFVAAGGVQPLRLVTAIRALTPTLPILGGDGLSYETPDDPTIMNQVFATTVTPLISHLESAQPFIAAYTKAYNAAPPDTAALGYEAMAVTLTAIQAAETPTRAGVLAALRQIKEYQGILGVWSFDANGDTTLTTITLSQYVENQWQALDVIE